MPISSPLSHPKRIDIFVDDTDIIHFRMDKSEDVMETYYHLQESNKNWGKLLTIATGGALKPSKCFFHLISFHWKPDGTWIYESNKDKNEYRVTVPTKEEGPQILFTTAPTMLPRHLAP